MAAKNPSTARPARSTPKSAQNLPPQGPLEDLRAAEAIVDLVRIAVERDFIGDRLECRMESAVDAAGHALYLVRRARLATAEALATRSGS